MLREDFLKLLSKFEEQNLSFLGMTGLQDSFDPLMTQTLELIKSKGLLPWVLTANELEQTYNNCVKT